MARPTQPDAFLQQRALDAHRTLCSIYSCPIPYFQSLDPLSELISSFLNHRTRNRDAKAAYLALRERFPTWEEVRDSPTGEVEAAIRGVRWPDMKAPRLQELLRLVEERHGAMTLEFLGDMPVAEARAWLEALPGVGPKTSAAVVSFSTLRGRALPVDSHHHRVAQRLGLIPPKMGVGPSHAVLEGYVPDEWDAQQVYDHHQVYMRHGQTVCHWKAPDCGACILLGMCPEGQRRTGGGLAA